MRTLKPDDERRATGNAPYVVGITGWLAIAGFFLAKRHLEPIDWALFALVSIATLGGIVALVRLIRRNPGAIGEARFDTRHEDDPI